MEAVKTVGFIGAGNLAWNIAANLPQHLYSIEQVITQTQASADAFADKFEVPLRSLSLSDLHPGLDIVFIGTPDKSIEKIANEISAKQTPSTLFIHGSGATSLNALAGLGKNIGVMWPLQTLTKDPTPDFKEVPIFIEAEDHAMNLVRSIAKTISNRVIYKNSEERLKVHMIAVFACNFPNMLYSITQQLSQNMSDVDLSVFEPAIRATIDKAMVISPHDSQTGPARRKDNETMNKHLEVLKESNPEWTTLYKLFSKIIGTEFND